MHFENPSSQNLSPRSSGTFVPTNTSNPACRISTIRTAFLQSCSLEPYIRCFVRCFSSFYSYAAPPALSDTAFCFSSSLGCPSCVFTGLATQPYASVCAARRSANLIIQTSLCYGFLMCSCIIFFFFYNYASALYSLNTERVILLANSSIRHLTGISICSLLPSAFCFSPI